MVYWKWSRHTTCHQIVVYGATSTCKNRGSMDPFHKRGSMGLVHILMDLVHKPSPRRGSMDQGSMFCTFPQKKYRGMFYYFIEKDTQKFRHFWRKKISWKSHLGQSCTKTFNYCLAVQPWLTLFHHISLSVLMVCSVPCIARYWLQISYGTRGGENWNRDSGLFLFIT